MGCELFKLMGDWPPKQMGLGLTPLPNSGSVTLGRLRYVFGVHPTITLTNDLFVFVIQNVKHCQRR